MMPPRPVDVPPDDLRAGKFQLNPEADAKRRALHRDPKAWIAFIIGWGAGYTPGYLLASAVPGLHIATFWGTMLGFFLVFAAYAMCLAAFARVTGRDMPQQPWTTAGVLAAAIGLISGLSR